VRPGLPDGALAGGCLIFVWIRETSHASETHAVAPSVNMRAPDWPQHLAMPPRRQVVKSTVDRKALHRCASQAGPCQAAVCAFCSRRVVLALWPGEQFINSEISVLGGGGSGWAAAVQLLGLLLCDGSPDGGSFGLC